MARHNRDARGVDQTGKLWNISFQPDWLSRVKISRPLPDDRRRSSLTIFRNPARRAEGSPGKIVKTRISSLDGSTDFRVSIEDPDRIVDSIIVVTRQRRVGDHQKEVVVIVPPITTWEQLLLGER